MNGDIYYISNPNTSTLTQFSTIYSEQYHNNVEYFDVYSDPITSKYGEVYWTLMNPVSLSPNIKNRFHHKCLEKFHNETGMCPMQCKKPKFLSIKKEVEKKLQKMQFKCRHHLMGCTKVLTYKEVASHDNDCEFTPVKCE